MKLGTEYTFAVVPGAEFHPSAALRAVKGVTWAGGDDHTWFVAYAEGEMVACCGLFIRNGQARFKTDVVAPDHRGQGLYRMLFEQRLAFAINCKPDAATTYSNKESRHQYEKAGFLPAGEESATGVLYMRRTFDKPVKSW